MNILLLHQLRAFVEEQVAEKGYGTSSEYMRELIRRDRDRQVLRNLVLEGVSSAPADPADARTSILCMNVFVGVLRGESEAGHSA